MNKIYHINSYYISNKVHADLVKKLDDRSWEQVIFIPVISKEHINQYLPEDLKHAKMIYKRCYNRVTRFIWPLKMMQIWHEFKKTVKKYGQPGIIHSHTLIVNGMIAYWANLKWGIPYVVTVRNTDINLFLRRYRLFRKLAVKILDKSVHIIALSPSYANKEIKQYFPETVYKRFKNKMSIIPNGINDYWIKNKYLNEHKNSTPKILFVGKLDRNKNLCLLVDACRIIKDNGGNVQLQVAGEGPLYQAIKKHSNDIDIKFFGHIETRGKLLKKYRQADILAVPSFTESFGVVYAEAMSQSLPVIYTKNQGFDGYFEAGEVGFPIDSSNAKDVAEKIRVILDNYKSMSRKAYDNAAIFSWKKNIRDIEAIYHNCLS